MSTDNQLLTRAHATEDRDSVRDIHALTPPRRPSPTADRSSHRDSWDTASLAFSNLSTTVGFSIDDYRAMSRELGALMLATPATAGAETVANESNIARIGEEPEEINALAIVPDTAPVSGGASSMNNSSGVEVSVRSVKKEEIESKILAWQTAEIAKANNKFKREDAIINGSESEEVQKANTWMKKVERKLEEQRVKAQEKMQNDVAKARRRAEERRASAESKRGTKVARILELANVMRVVGKAPSRRSIF